MSPSVRWVLVILVALACGSATCLYSGAGPIPATLQAPWHPILALIARALTIPFPSASVTGLRVVVIPACLAIALIVAAAFGCKPVKSESANAAETWLIRCALAVLCLGLISTFVNRSVDWSWGWLVRFAAGAGWAAILSHYLTTRDAGRAVLLVMSLAAIALVLAIAHRADRGLAHFQWPIGPITITAGLAATWGAIGFAYLGATVVSRRFTLSAMLSACLAILAVYVLLQTGRRASAIGLIAGIFTAGSLALWLKMRVRGVRRAVIASGVIALCIGGFYVVGQLRSPAREKSVPLALRFAYWRMSGDLIAAQPLLGYGPGTFLLHMTNAVAPLRSESPWIYEGDFDPAAHNEWIQAAVELGVPAALVYLALPLCVLSFALRRLSTRGLPPGDAAVILALIAGIVAVGITDVASVCLRGTVMPVWYFTLIGLLAALCKVPVTDMKPAADSRPLLTRMTFAAAATALALVVATELISQLAERRGVVGDDGRAGARLYPEETLINSWNAADLALRKAERNPEPANIDRAVGLWSELFQDIPGYYSVPESYARAELLAQNQPLAERVLTRSLEKLHPYSLQGNLLYAQLHPTDAIVSLQRALRANAWTTELESLCDRTVDLASRSALHDFDQRWEPQLEKARQIASASRDRPAADNSLELLRIRARILWRLGRRSEAIVDQQAAAEAYRLLERTVDPLRRASSAERDAFLELARMIYEADCSNYARAVAAVKEAERYAVLGIRHEWVRPRHPELGFIGGEVIPTEFPEDLRPLWRFSSLLHLIAGEEVLLDRRILSSMPMQDWSPENLNRELASLARRGYEDLSQLAPEKRPPRFERLRELARPPT